MAFREDSEAARARIDALERQLAESQRETERLRAGAGTTRVQAERSAVLRRPGLWVGLTAAMLGTAALIELDGGRPPWDELFPFLGAGSIACTLAAIATALWTHARPDEIVVLSGRRHRTPDGGELGYRVLAPGRGALRVPLLERVDRLDVGALPIELELRDASAGDGPIDVRVMAVVAIATTSPRVERAVERFLGRPRGDLVKVARETIEGATRAVIAKVEAKQVERERALVADQIGNFVEDDLDRLGLELTTLTLGEVRARGGGTP